MFPKSQGLNRLFRWTATKLGTALLIAASCSAANAETASAEASSADTALEEVVVTAQKREQNLQDVPIAVSVLTDSTLQAVRFVNVEDLNAVATGLTVVNTEGGTQEPVFSMRGIFGAATFASDPGIALYVDGVYIPAAVGAAFDLADINQIEVLRGPQGTLFGRNAIAGAINLITKEPTGKFDARQELTYGNFDQFRSKSHIDLPAWGPLSASLTYLHNERHGDTRNLGAGTVWDFSTATNGAIGKLTSPERLGDQDIDAVSAALKLELSGGGKLVYRYSYTHNDYTPAAEGLLSINPVDAVIVPLPPQPNPGILTTPSTTRPDAVNNAFSFPSTITTQDHNLTFSIPVEDIVAVKNILGYHKVNVSSTDQLDGYGGLSLDPAGDTFQYLVTNTTSDQYAFSDELQTVTNMKWTTLTVGAIYAHNRTVEGSFNGLPNSIALQVVPRAADGSFVVPLVPGREPSIVAVTSVAVYLQNEAHLTDSLDLVLGGRFTNDKKTGIDNSPLPAPSVTIDYKKSTPTYLAGLNYKLTDRLFTYAKYSTAYITGGDLAGVAFAPTKARSWEAGLKSDLLDRTLRANLAVFAVNYNDLQTLTTPTNPACVAAGASQSASQCIVNGGNLRDVGFELETTYRPIRELTLQGNVSYSDAKYTKVNPNIASPDGRLYPQHLPRWTAHLSSQYDGPRLVQAAHPFARVDANFTASQYNEINDDAANTALMRAPATWITNLRMGLAGFQVGSGQLEVAAWAKNLLNDNSLTKSSNLFFVIDAQYQPARTYGIDVNVDF